MMSNTQVCTKCKIDKDLDAYHADRRTGNRKRNVCIDCRQSQRQVTNLSTFEYAKLLVEQNNACAICGINADDLVQGLCVDHNHETNQVRGLLCNACNLGLGQFKDSVVFLSYAIEYLEQHDDFP